ncbi:transposase [Bradyrhizobium neotropicale]|nr:transposase [Bradyrhizobium neotropicale]
MREQLAKALAVTTWQASNYILKPWASFTLSLEDGRVRLWNNAAELTLRGIALGRKSCLFCGYGCGRRCSAALDSLIVAARMNGIEPQVAYGIPRLNRHPSGSSAGRTSALELDASISDLRPSGMTTHVNKVHGVITAASRGCEKTDQESGSPMSYKYPDWRRIQITAAANYPPTDSLDKRSVVALQERAEIDRECRARCSALSARRQQSLPQECPPRPT